MKFKKSTDKSKTPFGVYDIDKGFINALRKTDDNILDPEISIRYCGPLYHSECERGPVDFFAPVLPEYDKADMILTCFQDGIYAEYFDLKRMIPCVDTRFIKPNDKNENLIKFCKNNHDEMEHYAAIVMEAKE